MDIKDIIITVFSRAFFIAFLLICLPVLLLVIILPRSWVFNSKFFFMFEQFFHTMVLKLSLLPITFKGLSHITEDPALIVANHQSSFDIPLVGYTLKGHPHIWLSLATLRESPLLRWILPKVSILVDMSTPHKGMRTLVQAIDEVKKSKSHLIIFPEGGRYTDGKVHPFYGGFAVIARKTDRPVIPVYIHGINKVYPPGSFIIHQHPVHVIVGDRMTINENESDDDFKNRVYTWFVEQQNALQEH